jgi:regulator of cell morphogenesis and NO signaling
MTMSREAGTIARFAPDTASLTEVVRFILETHHVYTREAMASLPPLAAEVRGRHGEAHPETRSVERLVRQLADDLAPHMMKEEQILFPYIVALEEGAPHGEGPAASCFGSVRNPIRMMLAEHDTALAILADLRGVTRDYTPPSGASEHFGPLYDGLRELESDLKRHIGLENDILFPGAIRLEERGLPR